ncbi:sugar ABC transporter substrate-binding protein [Paenibacillus sp. sptzw28]|uniref:ABC transporter substrate-binding protein n=1 Tax=Paenibacillus sp. sptzw28 TaxID=715179 RepID=UPI001C6F4058|nr:sugar ABC transporter substrate-binding protein [Paenibacillus sp. sptzw28]QYR22375.1 sugar ABC transporter substrate-binding protein [Paenibacillus sp. sptzw28]
MSYRRKMGLAAMLIMLVMTSILAGCAERKENAINTTVKKSDNKEGQFLTVLVEGGSPAFTVVNETAEQFRKKTGYEIRVEAVPYIGVYDKLNAELKAKAGSYDVATIDILWFSTLAQGLAPMDDLMTDEVKNDLFPNLIDGGTVDGKALGMPVWTNSKILLYRKDLFEDPKEKAAFQKEYGYELKPPANWKEYRDAAKFFTRDTDKDGGKDLYGTSVFGMNNGDSVASWLDHAAQAGAGPLVVGEGGKALVNTKPYVEALDFLTKILREDKSAPEGALNMASSETSELFMNGKLSMMLAWGHFFVPSDDPAKSKVAGKVGAAPMIGGESGVGVVPGPWYQVIPSSSKKQAAAKEYVKFIYEHNELFMQALGVAARKSVFRQYGQKSEYAHLSALNSTLSAKQTQNRPVLEYWNEIESEALVPALQSALSGKATPQEALDQAADLINEIQGQ